MIECPLCSQYALEVYLNITHSFILCLDCILFLDQPTKRNQYVFHTLLNFHPSQQNFEANKTFKSKRLQLKQHFSNEQFAKSISKLYNKHQYEKQNSQSLTISTEDSEGSKEFLVKLQKSKIESIKEKYDQTVKAVKTFTKQLQPMKQTFSKTKNSIINSTKTFRNKISEAHTSYSNFSAELPPITAFAIKSVKQGFGGFVSKFF